MGAAAAGADKGTNGLGLNGGWGLLQQSIGLNLKDSTIRSPIQRQNLALIRMTTQGLCDQSFLILVHCPPNRNMWERNWLHCPLTMNGGSQATKKNHIVSFGQSFTNNWLKPRARPHFHFREPLKNYNCFLFKNIDPWDWTSLSHTISNWELMRSSLAGSFVQKRYATSEGWERHKSQHHPVACRAMWQPIRWFKLFM